MREQGYFDVSSKMSTILAAAGLAGLMATYLWVGTFVLETLRTLLPWFVAGRL